MGIYVLFFYIKKTQLISGHFRRRWQAVWRVKVPDSPSCYGYLYQVPTTLIEMTEPFHSQEEHVSGEIFPPLITPAGPLWLEHNLSSIQIWWKKFCSRSPRISVSVVCLCIRPALSFPCSMKFQKPEAKKKNGILPRSLTLIAQNTGIIFSQLNGELVKISAETLAKFLGL